MDDFDLPKVADDKWEREKAVLLMRRRWEIFETTKRVRTQLPVTLGGLLLAVTGFTLNSTTFPTSEVEKEVVASGLVVLTVLAIALIRGLHKQYDAGLDGINKAYAYLQMKGVTTGPEKGGFIWVPTYLIIAGIGCLGAVLILFRVSTGK